MKKFLIIALIFLTALTNAVYSQSIVWAKEFGTAGSGYAVSTDAGANAFVTGVIGGSPGLFDHDTIASNFSDIFIAKYNSAGIVQWEKTMGNVLVDGGDDIYTDALGNSYMVGYYRTNGIYPTINFDGVPLSGFGDADFYIAKYNSAGALQWVKNGGGVNGDFATGVSVDNGGNVYLCGYFNGSMSFLGSTISSGGGFSTDIFIARMDVNGNLIWLKNKGGTNYEYAYDITADNSGNIIVTGQFSGTINFDGITASSSGINDIYISKLNNSGTTLWLKQAGGNQTVNPERGNNITCDASDNYYVTGEFVKTASFTPFTITANGPTAADIFIAKYNSAGIIQWVHRGGGVDADAANAIAIDASNNLFITGFADSGPGVTFDSIALPPLGNEYVYLAKYNSSGIIQFVNQYAAGAGTGLDAGSAGCIVLTGNTSGTTFGGIPTPYVDRSGIVANYCEPVAGCMTPTSIFVNNITSVSARINWGAVPGAVKYKIQYRKSGDIAWINKNSMGTNKKLTGLTPSTTYEFRIRTICADAQSDFSAIDTFTTLVPKFDNLTSAVNFSLYPNPNRGEFEIFCDEPIDNATIEIFNVSGEVLKYKQTVHADGNSIHISINETKGIYFVRIVNNTNVILKQFIVE